MDVRKEIFDGSKRLSKSSKEIFGLAEDAAKAEKEYRKALAKEIQKLRDEGMAVGMIDNVARGNLSELLFKRDLAELKFTAGRDAMKSIQSQLSALQSILRSQEEI